MALYVSDNKTDFLVSDALSRQFDFTKAVASVGRGLFNGSECVYCQSIGPPADLRK